MRTVKLNLLSAMAVPTLAISEVIVKNLVKFGEFYFVDILFE